MAEFVAEPAGAKPIYCDAEGHGPPPPPPANVDRF